METLPDILSWAPSRAAAKGIVPIDHAASPKVTLLSIAGWSTVPVAVRRTLSDALPSVQRWVVLGHAAWQTVMKATLLLTDPT